MKQVALKGAIKLTKDKFDIDQDINQQLEVIKNISNNLFSYLKEGMEVATPTVHAPFDNEPVNEPIIKTELKSFTPKCPECKSEVEDNREKIKSDPKFAKIPVFSCTNKKGCDTGKGYSWATWNEDEFANAEKDASKDLPF
tara:strand:- start:1060 stop:1482 length:423 start_codon:yes stop_codon:yes gene_type:complete